MNDDWIKGASLHDIMALDTYAHLIQPADPCDPWNAERIRVIQTVAWWKFAVGHLKDAFDYEASIVPMLKAKYEDLAQQVAHKRLLYQSIPLQTVAEAIKRLEAQMTDERKLADWDFWKRESQSKTRTARFNLKQLTDQLEKEQTHATYWQPYRRPAEDPQPEPEASG